MASFMRRLAPQLVTHPPPLTPKDVYKLLGVSGPIPKDLYYPLKGRAYTRAGGGTLLQSLPCASSCPCKNTLFFQSKQHFWVLWRPPLEASWAEIAQKMRRIPSRRPRKF